MADKPENGIQWKNEWEALEAMWNVISWLFRRELCRTFEETVGSTMTFAEREEHAARTFDTVSYEMPLTKFTTIAEAHRETLIAEMLGEPNEEPKPPRPDHLKAVD